MFLHALVCCIKDICTHTHKQRNATLVITHSLTHTHTHTHRNVDFLLKMLERVLTFAPKYEAFRPTGFTVTDIFPKQVEQTQSQDDTHSPPKTAQNVKDN